MGHNHCREALSAALRLTAFYGEGRDEATVECFRDRLYVSQFAASMGRDVTRGLLRGYLDKRAEHPRGGTADFLPRFTCALHSMKWRGGAIRQAFQSHNRQVTAAQRGLLADWCEAVGYRMPTGGRMRALGA
ncbi:MAG: hypothetical protein LKJ98_02745 [Olsenella sp.]|jgi:hypothetical protein|nr:hypothetical protein [Olsenella sp.]